MQHNIIYDLFVIGASIEGLEFSTKIINKNIKINFGLISTDFPNIKLMNELKQHNINLIQGTVIYSEYNHGLHILTIKDQSEKITKLFCKNVVIATGITPITLRLKKSSGTKIYYSLKTLPKLAKNSQILIIGNSDDSLNAASELASHIKYVYIINNNLKLLDSKLILKTLEINNVSLIKNKTVTSINTNTKGKITSVSLSNGEILHCEYILVLLGDILAESGLNKNLVTIENERIVTNLNGVCKIPSVGAIGTATNNKSKIIINRLLNYLINLNNWKEEE